MKYITTVNGQTLEIEINREGEVLVNGEVRQVDFRALEGAHAVYSLIIDNKSYEAVVDDHDDVYQVLIAGDLYDVQVVDERTQRLMASASAGTGAGGGDAVVRSPMPGMIVKIPVEEGQAVQAGQTVIVLESMKMENELKAPYDGEIARVHVSAGDSVEQNKPLITVSPLEEDEDEA